MHTDVQYLYIFQLNLLVGKGDLMAKKQDGCQVPVFCTHFGQVT